MAAPLDDADRVVNAGHGVPGDLGAQRNCVGAVAGERFLEFLFDRVDVVVGLLDMIAGAVERIREVVDRAGVARLQLVGAFPGVSADRVAQIANTEIDRCRWPHRRACANPAAAESIELAADSSALVKACAAVVALADTSFNVA